MEKEPCLELVLTPQSSEFTIIEQPALPCAPDGFIPNSVTRMLFAHLVEFQLLFDQVQILRKVIKTR